MKPHSWFIRGGTNLSYTLPTLNHWIIVLIYISLIFDISDISLWCHECDAIVWDYYNVIVISRIKVQQNYNLGLYIVFHCIEWKCWILTINIIQSSTKNTPIMTQSYSLRVDCYDIPYYYTAPHTNWQYATLFGNFHIFEVTKHH